MKKSCIFLLVMSVISLLIAALGALGVCEAWVSYSAWKELNDVYGNDIDSAFTGLELHMQFLLPALTFVIGLVLGVPGLVGSVKRGRFTAVCMVLGGLLGLYALLGTVYHIVNDTGLAGLCGVVFAYAALYTAAAAAAFVFRKAA